MFGGTPLVPWLQAIATHYRASDWVDMHALLAARWYYSPLREFHLFAGNRRAKAIELLKLDDPLACAELVSPRPIHDGYLRALVIKPAEAGDLRATVDTFFAREAERDTEKWLYACYGEAGRGSDGLFDFIDYPAFDTGTMVLRYGLMIGHDGRRWLWSHAVFAHK